MFISDEPDGSGEPFLPYQNVRLNPLRQAILIHRQSDSSHGGSGQADAQQLAPFKRRRVFHQGEKLGHHFTGRRLSMNRLPRDDFRNRYIRNGRRNYRNLHNLSFRTGCDEKHD